MHVVACCSAKVTPRNTGVTSSHVHLGGMSLYHHCICVHFRRALGSRAKRCFHICHHVGVHRFTTAHSTHTTHASKARRRAAKKVEDERPGSQNSFQNGVNGLQKVKLSTRSVSSPKSEVWERSTCSSWVKSLSRLIAHHVPDVSKKDTHIATAVNVYFRQIGKNEG